MSEDMLEGYDRVEHYSSCLSLEKGLDADITVFTVYSDSTDSMDEEFQMIEYNFNRDVSRGLERFREKTDEFTNYRFFPVINDTRGPTEMTVMIDTDDRVEASTLAEELIEQAHEEIGL